MTPAQEENSCKWNGPDPLDCKGNAICPLRGQRLEAFVDASSDALSECPAKVDVYCQVTTKGYGADLGRISRRHAREYSPREAKEDLSRKECWEILREERNKHEGSDQE